MFDRHIETELTKYNKYIKTIKNVLRLDIIRD